MENLFLVSSISFILGVVGCHLFWKWYQSAELQAKISDLENSRVTRKLDLGGGVTFYRPYRLGKRQEGSDGKLHGVSEIRLIEHDGSVELFGVWNRNGKNQIDPHTLHIPISIDVIDPDRLVEFGQYFVELGNRQKDSENA